MILIEETTLPDAAMPLEALKRHLRAGTGFATDSVQDTVLTSFLRAALVAIEARTAKALLRRDFVLTLDHWTDAAGQTFPISPVIALGQVALVDRWGAADLLDLARFRISPDLHLPRLIYDAGDLPRVPQGGAAEIRFSAGFADGFAELPADLAQAVMLLAAHYYEYRDETALAEGCMPFGVTSLVARYRRTRIGLRA